MGDLRQDIDKASRGWDLWEKILKEDQNWEDVFYLVFFNNDKISLKALELLDVFRKEKDIKNIKVITDSENVKATLKQEEIRIKMLSEFELECILKYYCLHKFSDRFYVLSLDKLEQCCLKSVAEKLSLEEIILLGLFGLNKV